jgi:hypothetical protein
MGYCMNCKYYEGKCYKKNNHEELRTRFLMKMIVIISVVMGIVVIVKAIGIL